MLMSKRCLKCQHIAEIDSAVASCPACGAYYSKVEQAAQAAAAPQVEPEVIAAAPPKRPINVAATPAARPNKFIDELRAESIYPTFRGFVQVFYVIGLVIAAAMFIGGVFTTFFGGRNPMAFVAGACMAVLFVLIARLFKETWLMIADLSDATVRVARSASISARD